ncbi:MAG: glycosyltransferase family 2 protein [Methylococcaceae bacterium]|nr:glycosyltransferase family 2 protein [Methylococcaceae bacterium]MCI0668282.1 glycosyltransferase family 2 protein [Methylococcaceae bacterium]MCI0732984.1 glycosyltransferase family 2 protein [Methylococcaceae bacterium]
MSKDKKTVSLVVPVFNEIEVIDTCYRRLSDVMSSLREYDYELIFVDDGSHDGSWEKLMDFQNLDPHLKVIKFSRNFGHQIAITAGIDHAKGAAVVVIDADLQDPPEIIADMIARWEQGYDVVYGVRKKRDGESWLKLLTASAFYRVLKKFTSIEIPVDVGDFRLMSARAANQLKQLREKDRFIRGLVSWIGFRQTGVPYHREERFAGETKYPFKKMAKFALDGITSFSSIPLKFASWLGFMTSLLAFLYLFTVFIQKAMGYTIEGWATIMVAMLFLGGVQLICLGIIGEYIGRIFTEIKSRPMYVIESINNEPTTLVGETCCG